MQGVLRKKNLALAEPEARELLARLEVAYLATADLEGQPYAVPIQYVCDGENIYFHCAKVGHKMENLKANPKVSVAAHEFRGLNFDPNPCDTSTAYASVVVFGEAAPVTDLEAKAEILKLIVAKYFPELVGTPMAEAAVAGVQVMAVKIGQITGKVHA